MRGIFWKYRIYLSITVLLVLAITRWSWSLKRIHPMFLDGEIRKTIRVKNDKVHIDCFYDTTSVSQITLCVTMYGRKFAINPACLSISASNPNVIIVPHCEENKNFEESARVHSSYTFPRFKRVTNVSHTFDVILKSPMDTDTISMYILPSDYLTYENIPVICDTIAVWGIIASDTINANNGF